MPCLYNDNNPTLSNQDNSEIAVCNFPFKFQNCFSKNFLETKLGKKEKCIDQSKTPSDLQGLKSSTTILNPELSLTTELRISSKIYSPNEINFTGSETKLTTVEKKSTFPRPSPDKFKSLPEFYRASTNSQLTSPCLTCFQPSTSRRKHGIPVRKWFYAEASLWANFRRRDPSYSYHMDDLNYVVDTYDSESDNSTHLEFDDDETCFGNDRNGPPTKLEMTTKAESGSVIN